MLVDGYHFMTDIVAKFHRCLFVSGWFIHESESITQVEITGPGVLSQVGEVNLEHGSVVTRDGRPAGFKVECLKSEEAFSDDLMLVFTTSTGRRIESRLIDLATERIVAEQGPAIYHAFMEAVSRMNRPTVVDVGGRDRSAFDRSVHFPNTNYIVVDILPSKNVDIVGDAHALSDHFPAKSADAIISAFTFEHLLMPWKVVIEMNKILKDGGIVCVLTHQTLGMHDLPWDFWRFSADAWSALFNPYTGFEIIETTLASPQFVIPFAYHHGKAFAERGAGYELSAVLAKKTGPALVDWPVPVKDVIDTMYPNVDDGPSAAAKVKKAGKPKGTKAAKKRSRKPGS